MLTYYAPEPGGMYLYCRREVCGNIMGQIRSLKDCHAKKKMRRSQDYQDLEKEVVADFKAGRWHAVLHKSEYFHSD